MGTGSIQLARLFGIRIGASPSWFVVLFLMIYYLSGVFDTALEGNSNDTAYVVAVIGALLFFVSLVLHELGHALVARRNGIGVSSIELWFFGGLAKLTRDPTTPGVDFRISAAGPAVTLAILVACCGGLAALGVTDLGEALTLSFATTTPAKGLVSWLAGINLVVLVFNLLPAFPLDGGRIVRAIAWKVTGDQNRGTRLAARLGQVLAWGLMGLGAYVAVSAALFALGITVILARRNIIYILMGIEMILNAANINFVAFNRFGSMKLDGQMFAIFVIILAAAEAAVALAIVLNVFYLFDSIKPGEADLLRE